MLAFPTTRPLRGPLVQRYFLTARFPLLPHVEITPSVISRKSIYLFLRDGLFNLATRLLIGFILFVLRAFLAILLPSFARVFFRVVLFFKLGAL